MRRHGGKSFGRGPAGDPQWPKRAPLWSKRDRRVHRVGNERGIARTVRRGGSLPPPERGVAFSARVWRETGLNESRRARISGVIRTRNNGKAESPLRSATAPLQVSL